MHNISTRVVCENGKHPWSLPFYSLRSLHRVISSIQTRAERLTQGTAGTQFMIKKETWHVLGKVQASREFLGVGAYASLDILKNWNFLKAAFREFERKYTIHQTKVIAPTTWYLRTIYSEIDLRCLKWHWFEQTDYRGRRKSSSDNYRASV